MEKVIVFDNSVIKYNTDAIDKINSNELNIIEISEDNISIINEIIEYINFAIGNYRTSIEDPACDNYVFDLGVTIDTAITIARILVEECKENEWNCIFGLYYSDSFNCNMNFSIANPTICNKYHLKNENYNTIIGYIKDIGVVVYHSLDELIKDFSNCGLELV